MRDMACGGPYFSKLLLNAIYFGASKFSPRLDVRKDPNDVRTAGWEYRERVRKLLGSALDRSDVTTIQALLIMANSLFALGDERSAAWLYAGLAFRMIVDLGMHVDVSDLGSTRKFSDEDLEIRRRVFWAAFSECQTPSSSPSRAFSLTARDQSWTKSRVFTRAGPLPSRNQTPLCLSSFSTRTRSLSIGNHSRIISRPANTRDRLPTAYRLSRLYAASRS